MKIAGEFGKVSGSDFDKKIDEKLDTVLRVLQNFGLQMIQKLGELKHTVEILVDKMEKLEKALTDVKGMGVKLDESIRAYEKIGTQIRKLENMILSMKVMDSGGDSSNPSSMIDSPPPEEILQSLLRKVDGFGDVDVIADEIENAKEKIFEITGGHRVLFEMGSFVKSLRKEKEITDDLREEIRGQIRNWIKKISF